MRLCPRFSLQPPRGLQKSSATHAPGFVATHAAASHAPLISHLPKQGEVPRQHLAAAANSNLKVWHGLLIVSPAFQGPVSCTTPVQQSEQRVIPAPEVWIYFSFLFCVFG